MPRAYHTGNTTRVRDLLQSSWPLTSEQIAERLGMRVAAVRYALNEMMSRIGGAEVVRREGRFNLYGPPGTGKRPTARRSANGSGVIAPKPYRMGFRWGNVSTTGQRWGA